jgi:hypothetical protein
VGEIKEMCTFAAGRIFERLGSAELKARKAKQFLRFPAPETKTCLRGIPIPRRSAQGDCIFLNVFLRAGRCKLKAAGFAGK